MKVEFDKKKIKKLVLGAGLAGALVFGATNLGFHINSETHLPDFYYLNTKNIDMDSDELLGEFNGVYESSEALQENWSCIYPELSDFILKYGDYLDQEELLDTLGDLKFEIVDGFGDNKQILAVTNFKDLSISYNERLFYKKDSEIKEMKLHEAFHYLFHQNFSGSMFNFPNLGRQLDEGTASLLTREYGCYAGVDIYGKNANYVRVICELIGPENYMKATGNHDLLELIGYLTEYCSYGDALQLIKNIDEACIYYDSKKTEYDEAAWQVIDKMYFKKHGCSISDSKDLAMKIYSNELMDTDYNIEGARSNYQAHLEKNYFINVDQPKVVYMKMQKKYGEVSLDDQNMIASGSILKDGYYSDNGSVCDDDGNLISESFIEYNSGYSNVKK